MGLNNYEKVELDEFVKRHPDVEQLELFYFTASQTREDGEYTTEEITAFYELDIELSYVGLVSNSADYIDGYSTYWMLSDTLEDCDFEYCEDAVTQSYDPQNHRLTVIVYRDTRERDYYDNEVSQNSVWARTSIITGDDVLDVTERATQTEPKSLYDFLKEHPKIRNLHRVCIRKFACFSHFLFSGTRLNYTFERRGSYIVGEHKESVSEFHEVDLEMVKVGTSDGTSVRCRSIHGNDCVRTVQVVGPTLYITDFEDDITLTQGNLPPRIVELDTKILVAPFDTSTGEPSRIIDLDDCS